MKNPEGFVAIEPVIERVSFARKGFITLYLHDGRVLMSPLSKFPTIERLTPQQRRKLSIVDDQSMIFQDADEIFHLEQFLGREQQYKYKMA
ncbi:MAG: DUF2442 domain-containing protein [Rudanella sp.]|nr:DUF2442 domain-containing protein [Rudanella sp.]